MHGEKCVPLHPITEMTGLEGNILENVSIRIEVPDLVWQNVNDSVMPTLISISEPRTAVQDMGNIFSGMGTKFTPFSVDVWVVDA